MNRSRLFTVFSVVFAVFTVLIIFVTLWYWSDNYPDFNDFRQESDIHGLQEGAVPQGLAMYSGNYTITDEDGKTDTIQQDVTITSAYFSNGSPSKLYVSGSVTGYIGSVTVKDGDTLLNGHFGGVATNGSRVWICDDSIIYVLSYSSVINAAKSDATVEITSKFHANCRASFLYYYDDTTSSNSDKLYVGEFYKKGKYETDPTHHITTPNGDTNRAFVYQYSVSTVASNIYGLSTLSTSTGLAGDDVVPKIDRIISITDEIQGFARTPNGSLVLSQSYGLKNSNLIFYKYTDTVSTATYIDKTSNRALFTTLSGEKFFRYHRTDGSEIKRNRTDYNPDGVQYTSETSLYVYFADNAQVRRTYSVPSMSEGLAAKNDRIYVLFESGAKKYRLFVRQPINNIYSFIPRTK